MEMLLSIEPLSKFAAVSAVVFLCTYNFTSNF